MRSAALKRLMGMAGRSLAIYNGLADLCRVRLRDSESPYCGVKEASYCTLRSQLLMALHDNNISEITSKVGVFCKVHLRTAYTQDMTWYLLCCPGLSSKHEGDVMVSPAPEGSKTEADQAP